MSGYDILREHAARFDFRDKVTGSARYCADLFPDGMLFARTLRSQRPRAWLRSVYVPPLPEGYTVIDYRDIPHKNVVPIVMEDQPFFAEKTVNYIGEPILLVAGPDREVLQALLE